MKRLWITLAGFCTIGLLSCDPGAQTTTGNNKDGFSSQSAYLSPGVPIVTPSGPGETMPIDGSKYNDLIENSFIETNKEPISTFSIDADGASYTNMRRYINAGTKPPANAIRTEELMNYFTYNYPEPTTPYPLSINSEVSSCPWNTAHRLVRIGFKGKTMPESQIPVSNIVLLIDVSGSMDAPNKLQLLKDGLMVFVDQLREQDKLGIVIYAGAAGVPLPATSGANKSLIKDVIQKLGAGGSTAGAQGIITAYDIAQKNFVHGGNNRVILMTDGDFNVGPSSQKELVDLIATKRDLGIFLTVVGVGTGNLNDAMMEQVADKGNGIYEYIDNLEQAKKVFVYEFHKFFTVAKDVKIQISFNPAHVQAYRLVGYENRLLEKRDFSNDAVDAGDLSASQTVTALYEIIPAQSLPISAQMAALEFRYKLPDEGISNLLQHSIVDNGANFAGASENMRFAAAVATYSLILRNSKYNLNNITYSTVQQWVDAARSFDPYNFRLEFSRLLALMR